MFGEGSSELHPALPAEINIPESGMIPVESVQAHARSDTTATAA
jgi:hypothetical protein